MVPRRRPDAHDASPAAGSLAAMVIVRAASGRRLGAAAPISAATLAAHAARPADVNAARAAFTEWGFEAGPFVGISFAISAPQSTFEHVFDVRIVAGADGLVTVTRGGVTRGIELPLDHLPDAVQRRLEAVSFAPPVELHAPSPMT